MKYEEALAFIHGAYGRGEKRGLENMRVLMERLGHPERQFRAMHVAGTNGKGSVCAFLQAVLRCSGYKTGLYTSPFLQRYNERMRVDGMPIPDDRLAGLTVRVARVVEAMREEHIWPTEFEIGTAIAYLYFAEEKVDIAVIEVGLGGRLDPTNVIHPCVSVIAAIGLDHMKVLGNSLEAIAAEKAGIIKRRTPVVVSSQNDEAVLQVIKSRSVEVDALFYAAEPTVGIGLGLPGRYQEFNAGVAMKALVILREKGYDKITDDTVAEGLKRTRWPGRLEWVERGIPLLLDGAHNEQGAHALADYVAALPPMKNLLVCGIMQDKAWQQMVAALAEVADEVIAVSPTNPRALPATKLAAAFLRCGVHAAAVGSVSDALQMAEKLAKTAGEGRIIVAGSLYLVGETRAMVTRDVSTLLSPA